MQQVKQVIVIRKDLNMRKGKIAAQASHASMKVFFDRISAIGDKSITISKLSPAEMEWIKGAFTKVVVSVDSLEQLEAVYASAKEKGIPASLIIDAGRTEFNGVPTKTAVAIGPHWSEEVDKITGDLSLL